MSGTSIEQYRQDLEAQLRGREFLDELARLKKAHPVFVKYSAIEDLVALAQAGNRDYAYKDAVLRALLTELKQSAVLFPLLNVMFWESLLRLYRRKCRSVSDPEELFERIQLDFYHTASEYPLERRPRKIDVNLLLDTRKKVTRWQREEALHRSRHEALGCAHEAHPPLAQIQESTIYPEEMETYLLDLVYRKVINRHQMNLILEVDVYRRMTEKQWAEARGFAYATVRSWHFRAEAAIRKYEKDRRKREGETE